MSSHCQLTLNETHVFFADPDPLGPSYLLNWPEQTWTELPEMENYFTKPGCGLIHNPTRGLEAVVAAFRRSEIFNFYNQTWRAEPTPPDFQHPGFTQLGDTFVVVGGYSIRNNTDLDTIYKFDNINYDWVQLAQHLQIATADYPGVTTVPDSFVNCN